MQYFWGDNKDYYESILTQINEKVKTSDILNMLCNNIIHDNIKGLIQECNYVTELLLFVLAEKSVVQKRLFDLPDSMTNKGLYIGYLLSYITKNKNEHMINKIIDVEWMGFISYKMNQVDFLTGYLFNLDDLNELNTQILRHVIDHIRPKEILLMYISIDKFVSIIKKKYSLDQKPSLLSSIFKVLEHITGPDIEKLILSKILIESDYQNIIHMMSLLKDLKLKTEYILIKIVETNLNHTDKVTKIMSVLKGLEIELQTIVEYVKNNNLKPNIVGFVEKLIEEGV